MTTHHTKHVAEAYGRHAESYVALLEPTLQPMANEIRHIVSLDEDMRVLDLATGTGLLARAIIRANTFVMGVDVAHGALITAHRLSLGRIPCVVGDAHRLPCVDGCIDLVTCGLGLSHFGEVSLALREIRRVLRSGGRLVATAWNTERGDPLFSAVMEALRSVLAHVEDPFKGTCDEATWGDPVSGCQVLKQAGFEEVQVVTRPLCGRYRTPREAVEYVLAWPAISARMAHLTQADYTRAWDAAISAVMIVNDLHQHSEIRYYYAISPGA